jgi:Protein of unknown function (DUF3071)
MPMQELRLVAVSEDGTYVILTQPGRGTRFSLPNDERLRAVARGQFSRLAQYEIEVESPLRPKEIQARIRAGETADQIADTAGVPVDRVRWFEGPVLAERAYIAQQAQNASVRRPGESGPGPRLGEIVAERLRAAGGDPEDADWDSVKRVDGSWLVKLAPSADGRHDLACWVFDIKRRHAIPDNDEAARLSLPEDALAEAGLSPEPEVPARRSGTVTPFVPRSAPHPDQPTPRPAPSPSPQPPSPQLEPERVRQPAPGTRAAGSASPAAAPHARGAAGMPRSQPPPADIPRPKEPPAEPPSPDVTTPAPQRRATAGAGGGAAARARAATADEATPAQAGGRDEAAATQGQGQGQQAASNGRGGRRGKSRRSSVPSWDEIMFGDSRNQD